jgi:NAD(P)H-hydrate epimerase
MDGLGIPGIVLMENAGRGCAEVLQEHAAARQEISSSSPSNPLASGEASDVDSCQTRAVLVCCGPGNNGGDGFVIARHLWLAGMRIKVVLVSERHKYHGDALTNLRIIENLRLEIVDSEPSWTLAQWLSNLSQVQHHPTDWVIDAVLGTGAQGPLKGPFQTVVEAINLCSAKRLAVDLPTGLDCDTGESSGNVVRADLTCTFVEKKMGFRNPKATQFLGEVVVVGIGAPCDSAG